MVGCSPPDAAAGSDHLTSVLDMCERFCYCPQDDGGEHGNAVGDGLGTLQSGGSREEGVETVGLAQASTADPENSMSNFARHMAIMILKEQAQIDGATERAAAVKLHHARSRASLIENRMPLSIEDLKLIFTYPTRNKGRSDEGGSSEDKEEEDDEEEDKEDEEDEDELEQLSEVLLDLKNSGPPPPPPPDGGSGGWASRRPRTGRYRVGYVDRPPTKKATGRSNRNRGRGRGQKKNACSITCNHMDSCSILGGAGLCPDDLICQAYQASAGSYFALGSCRSRALVGAIGAASGLLGRSLEKQQSSQLGGGGGGRGGRLACLCNSTYVSRGCCDGGAAGLVWESPGLNLLVSEEIL
jgi:hypothetical protein